LQSFAEQCFVVPFGQSQEVSLMKALFVAVGAAAISLVALSSAEAACRQVYGGTSCNWLGHCWHNPPKTVCDAPAKIATPSRPPTLQPGSGAGLISNKGGGIISSDGAGMRNNRLVGPDGASMIGNSSNTFNRR
jgi:hypothetical protein